LFVFFCAPLGAVPFCFWVKITAFIRTTKRKLKKIAFFLIFFVCWFYTLLIKKRKPAGPVLTQAGGLSLWVWS